MNVEIRRQGIVIKTIPVHTERVRIGSGESCEIQLNDPFLTPVVAEMVKRNNEWRMVDAGTSLDGISRAGARVMDERVEPGEPYIVGAFELVVAPELGSRHAVHAAGVIPSTQVEVDLGVLPATGVLPSTMVQPSAPASKANPGKLVFAPVEAPRGAPPAVPHASKKAATPRRLLLVVAAVVATICVGLALVVATGEKKPKPVATSTTATSTASPAPAVPAVNGDQLAANLSVEQAFAVWEAEFARQPSEELRNKIVRGSMELGRAYAAAHDGQTAAKYFAKVTKYGDPNSEAVRLARARVAAVQ